MDDAKIRFFSVCAGDCSVRETGGFGQLEGPTRKPQLVKPRGQCIEVAVDLQEALREANRTSLNRSY